jgi:acyl-CoA reductase-like NAD-dependent aldehyde dehydrogenase
MTSTTAPPHATDPSTGDPLPPVADDDPSAVDGAVAAARAAQRGWAATPPAERAAALKRVAAAVREHADALAYTNARETGKLIGDAHGGGAGGRPPDEP